MVLHYTLTTVITCTITEILHGLLLHIYVPLVHEYNNAQTTAFHIIVIIITWILGISMLHMHAWFLYSCHMDHRSYCMSYSCILVTWLFPVTVIDIPVTGYMSSWYAMCGIPHLLFPVSRYRDLCYQQSSCYVIVLHVPYPVLVPDILYRER